MADKYPGVRKPDFSQVKNLQKTEATPSTTPRPDFSNVRSGGSSTAPAVKTEGVQKLHTVVAGDTLSKIAKKEYGNAKRWRVIFEANQDILKNPDLIHPGQVLKIPTEPTEGNA